MFSDVQIVNFISSILDNVQSKSSRHDDFHSYPPTLKSYQNGTLLTVLHSLFAWNKKQTNKHAILVSLNMSHRRNNTTHAS